MEYGSGPWMEGGPAPHATGPTLDHEGYSSEIEEVRRPSPSSSPTRTRAGDIGAGDRSPTLLEGFASSNDLSALAKDSPTVLSSFPSPDSNKKRLFKVFVVPKEEALDEYGRPVVLTEEELLSRQAAREAGQAGKEAAEGRGFLPLGGAGRVGFSSSPTSPTSSTSPSPLFSPPPSGRQYWMPDRLCRSCYNCEQPFTMLRRRHHCRCCGQVFCSSCSAYYVDGRIAGVGGGAGSVRCCKLCLDQVMHAHAGGLVPPPSSVANSTANSTPASPPQPRMFRQSSVQQLQAMQQQMGQPQPPTDAAPLPSTPSGSGKAPPGFVDVVSSLTSNPSLGGGGSGADVARPIPVSDGGGAAMRPPPPGPPAPPPPPQPPQPVPPSTTAVRQQSAEKAGTPAAAEEVAGRHPSPPKATTAALSSSKDRPPSLSVFEQALSVAPEASTEAGRYECQLDEAAEEHWTTMLQQLVRDSGCVPEESKTAWSQVMTRLVKLATDTVSPDVRGGDQVDIRPYVQVKVIPGGDMSECAYVDGLVFRKNLAHKRMATELRQPRIMLLSGGIEFQRTESRITSLETLVDQEARYMQILVDKIMGLRPDLLVVGKTVSRRAQDHLINHKVTLMQNVKPQVLDRLARLSGARILASTDHVMSQHGERAIGTCGRFRLVRYGNGRSRASRQTQGQEEEEGAAAGLMSDEEEGDLPPPIFTSPQDNRRCDYAYVEGCPPYLGCSLVLRGDAEPVLKEVKHIIELCVCVAYNLRLERAYLNDRFVFLPPPPTRPPDSPAPQLLSSSLQVDLGQPTPTAFKNEVKTLPSSPFEHQQLLITSVWMKERQQCSPAEVKRIAYYSSQDVSLGQFLLGSCFNPHLRCHNIKCQRSMLDHLMSFSHRDGRVTITTRKLPRSLPDLLGQAAASALGQQAAAVPSSSSSTPGSTSGSTSGSSTPQQQQQQQQGQGSLSANGSLSADQFMNSETLFRSIYMCSECKQCKAVVTPLVEMSEETWKWSFGKLLEVMFYNRAALARPSVAGCTHSMQRDHVLWFGCGDTAARFEYEPVLSYHVVVPSAQTLLFPQTLHEQEVSRLLLKTGELAGTIFHRFQDRIHDMEDEAQEIGSTLKLIAAHASPGPSPAPSSGTTTPNLSATSSPAHQGPLNAMSGTAGNLAELQQELHAIVKELKEMDAELKHAAETVAELLAQLMQQTKGAGGGGSKGEAAPASPSVDSSTAEASPSSKPAASAAATPMEQAELELFPHQCQRRLYLQALAWNERIVTAGQGMAELENQAATLAASLGVPTASTTSEGDGGRGRPSVDAGLGEELQELPAHHRVALERTLSDECPSLGGSGCTNTGTCTPVAPTEASQGQDEEGGGVVPPATQQQGEDASSAPGAVPLSSSAKTAAGLPPLPGKSPAVSGIATIGDRQPRLLRHQSLRRGGRTSTVSTTKNTLTQALARLLGGRDLWGGAGSAYAVEVEDLLANVGRLGLEPGRGGMVIPVLEDSPSTVVAYALCCHNYTYKFRQFQYQALGRALPEDEDAVEAPLAMSMEELEAQMLWPEKSHIKVRFEEKDSNDEPINKFVCNVYWSSQFHAFRCAFLQEDPLMDDAKFIRSLATSGKFDATGGKSGATFSITDDGRFVLKQINDKELAMFLDAAPAYFEYLSKALFHGHPTLLCKILGLYEAETQNKITGKKTFSQLVVMPNIFFQRHIHRTYDLKGSTRSRYINLSEQDQHQPSPSGPPSPQRPSSTGSLDPISPTRSSSQTAAPQQAQPLSTGKEAGQPPPPTEGTTPPHQAAPAAPPSTDPTPPPIAPASTAEGGGSQRPPSAPPVPTLTGTSQGSAATSSSSTSSTTRVIRRTLLDENLMEFTEGRPLPIYCADQHFFYTAMVNDTLFLSVIKIIDYSILVGVDEERRELVVGLIDYMRQYDIIKKMERMGKSVGMIAGQAEPTVIQPQPYRARFQTAMERYFMQVPDKWTSL